VLPQTGHANKVSSGFMSFLSGDTDRLTVCQDGEGIEAGEYAKRFRENLHRAPPVVGPRR